MRIGKVLYAAILMGSTAVNSAVAQSNEGESLYMEACAVCHGASAMGQGPLSEFMNIEVPSLLELSRNNDGVFPMLEVIQTIDARSGIRPHGSEMPFWGNLFKADAVDDAGVYGSEVIVRGKILSLAQYLESIQVE